jgi:hypothetical protein
MGQPPLSDDVEALQDSNMQGDRAARAGEIDALVSDPGFIVSIAVRHGDGDHLCRCRAGAP